MTLRHVIIDVGGLSYWKLHSIASKKKVEDTGMSKEALMALESEKGFKEWIFEVKLEVLDIIRKFNPDRLTLACDGKNLWRKDIYPEYKDNRKNAKAQVPIDWSLFYETRDKLMLEFEQNLPVNTILIDRIEADDIAAILCEKLSPTEDIIALTNDKDWHQLFKYRGVRIFKLNDSSPASYYHNGFSEFGRTEIVGVDPVKVIQMKILTGDTGDHIPNLKPRLGEKTAEKVIMEYDGNIYAYAMKEGLLEAFERNQRLINLDRIPQDIKDLIWNTYNSKNAIVVDHLLLSEFFKESYDQVASMSHLHMFSSKHAKNLGWN